MSHATLIAEVVVDIDNTIFIQGALFLALVFVLDRALFRPWLAVRDRRRDRIEGALDRAERLERQAADVEARIVATLAAARDDAGEQRVARRRSAERRAEEILSEAREQAETMLERARARAILQAEDAERTLRTEVSALARAITARLIGRAA